MSALERVAASLAVADKRGEPYVCATVELTRDDLRELIATVEKRDAEVEDLVEKFQTALHAETERGNALAMKLGCAREALRRVEIERDNAITSARQLADRLEATRSERDALRHTAATAGKDAVAEHERANALAVRVAELEASNKDLVDDRDISLSHARAMRDVLYRASQSLRGAHADLSFAYSAGPTGPLIDLANEVDAVLEATKEEA